ncbi:MAG TPA: potassium-transporting ATPase subunit KdpB, partial [Gaiellales bacterium]|nr:potassium-transporting ATPase subunit KdpB [Gaiellales bacterium]
IVEGVGSVDESAITGESAPVIREAGGDRSAVTGGTRLLSDRLVIEITQEPGQSFLDRMISLVEGAERRKTPNEVALNILLAGLTFTFLAAVVTLAPFASYAGSPQSQTVLIALLVALIPTTIGALLSAIGIAGMDRLVQRNVLAMSGRAVEASGDVDVLLLDKTGTITLGNRQASEFIPVDGVTDQELAEAAQLSSLSDETPEGRSIVVLAKERYGLRERQLSGVEHEFVPFSATTRMSGVDMNGNRLRKGAADAIKAFVSQQGGRVPERLDAEVDGIARAGGTPLVVAQDNFVLGVIHLKDIVKGGMRERFDELRRMGIRTVMITGDNRVTAAVIAQEAGVDDFLAEATPEAKMTLIREEQGKGRMVAMTGDGTNDAPALAQADVGVAMNTGTSAAKEAGNMVDLDSNPTKLIEIVEVGKQLLITRGSLTTFSIANDVAKYFAILPAMFAFTYGTNGGRGPLDELNVMNLGTPKSAILSAIIFNALIIPALVPLALRGVRYRAIGATALLRRNLLIYGLGGVILPFVGIKAIDLVVHNLFGA